MNNQERDKLRKSLEVLASRVRSDAESMLERTRQASGGNGGSELSNAPFHLGDMGTEEYLYDLNATLLENEQYIAVEASEALRRMDNGHFGLCEKCGHAIGTERLNALPFTRYCVGCAERNDRTPQVNLDRGRPHSPEDTLAPEGEMNESRVHHHDALENLTSRGQRGDNHAAGTAGGGTPIGGLAGGTEGAGDPIVVELEEATGSSFFDAEDDRADDKAPRSGPSGGAVGGTPAGKRAR